MILTGILSANAENDVPVTKLTKNCKVLINKNLTIPKVPIRGLSERNHKRISRALERLAEEKYAEAIDLFKNLAQPGNDLKYKLNLQNNFRFGVELNMRKTFTDYLDDVSETYVDKFQLQQASGEEAVHFSDPNNQGELGKNRGNANNTDWFYSLGFSLTYVIKTKALKCSNPSLE